MPEHLWACFRFHEMRPWKSSSLLWLREFLHSGPVDRLAARHEPKLLAALAVDATIRSTSSALDERSDWIMQLTERIRCAGPRLR